MAYATEADLLDRLSTEQLIELTTDDPAAQQPDSGRITQAITDADSEINSYAAKHYSVPLDPVPAVIQKYSVDLALYNLYTRADRPDLDESDAIVRRYQDARKFLQYLAEGKVTLGELPSPSENTERQGSYTGNDRVFTRDNMEGF